MNIKALNGKEITSTDSKALAYMYPASLAFPLNHDWTQIYLYLASESHRGNTEKNDFRMTVITEIKGSIDNIDKLSESDVSLLMQMIPSLTTTTARSNPFATLFEE